MERIFSPLHFVRSVPQGFRCTSPQAGWNRPLALKTGTSNLQIPMRGSVVILTIEGIRLHHKIPTTRSQTSNMRLR